MIFFLFICFLILQRVSELFIARRNEKWLLKIGAVEYGQKHYPYIIALHTLFIISLIAEYIARGDGIVNYSLLILFFLLIVLKLWAIASLGKYWSTKIFRVPGSVLIKKGPYKYIKHPNYMIVIGEIAVIPLIFNLYVTAIVFSILNAIMLNIRIKEENKVWKS